MVKVCPAEYFVSPLSTLPRIGKTKRGGQTCCDTIAVLDFGCCFYHLNGQIGQLTVSVNGKQNCHSFQSVPFPEKRQRRPESGIKDGFDEMEHEFPFGTFRPKNFLQTFCKTLNVWSNILYSKR